MAINGNARGWLTIAGVLGAVGLVFSAGSTYTRLTYHVDNEAIHQGVEEKQEMMDKRMSERLGPRLDAIDKHLATIDDKLDWMRQQQINGGS